MVGDRERITAAGFDGYIQKPIDPETFVSQIERFLRTSSHSTTLPQVNGEFDPHSRRSGARSGVAGDRAQSRTTHRAGGGERGTGARARALAPARLDHRRHPDAGHGRLRARAEATQRPGHRGHQGDLSHRQLPPGGSPADRRRVRGLAHILVKPCEPEEIVSAVREALRRLRSSACRSRRRSSIANTSGRSTRSCSRRSTS